MIIKNIGRNNYKKYKMLNISIGLYFLLFAIISVQDQKRKIREEEETNPMDYSRLFKDYMFVFLIALLLISSLWNGIEVIEKQLGGNTFYIVIIANIVIAIFSKNRKLWLYLLCFGGILSIIKGFDLIN